MKIKLKHIVFWVLSLLLIHINLAGCNLINIPVLNNQSDTITNDVKVSQYIPKSSSAIQIEFDFPESWLVEDEYIIKGTNITHLSFFDPRYVSIPTRSTKNDQESIPEYGYLTIEAYPIIDDRDYEKRIEDSLNMLSGIQNIQIIDSYKSIIDDEESFIIETNIDPSEDNKYQTSMFEKVIFFVANSQIYQIIIIIPQDERESDFEKGCNLLLSSIKILD